MESVHIFDKNQTKHNNLEVEYVSLTVKNGTCVCSQLGSRHCCASLRKTTVSYQLTLLQIQKTRKVNK